MLSTLSFLTFKKLLCSKFMIIFVSFIIFVASLLSFQKLSIVCVQCFRIRIFLEVVPPSQKIKAESVVCAKIFHTPTLYGLGNCHTFFLHIYHNLIETHICGDRFTCPIIITSLPQSTYKGGQFPPPTLKIGS